MKRVRFSLTAPEAKTVLLVGDFTDWDVNARRMRRTKARADTFATTVALEPGTYEYKFIVDGQWLHDPEAESVPNCFGTQNSIITVE
jgi:1,4-alpha-glucan branching enzyme